MNEFIPKLIDCNHYLLWTDALHSRKLASQTKSKWDKATYVRTTILLAWTVLEIACQDSLGKPEISYSFKRKIDEAISDLNLPPLIWGNGIWQKVTQLQTLRKNIVHRFANEPDLFPDNDIADFAIEVVRDAIKSIYVHANIDFPRWVDDDADTGWPGSGVGLTDSVSVTVIKKGAQGAENPIKIYYIANGKESLSDVLAPNDDYQPYVDSILNNSTVPISEIRVIQGSNEIFHESYNIRGT